MKLAPLPLLTPPVSKSDAQRALVLARILGWPELAKLNGPEDELPADVRVMARGLKALDATGPAPLSIACDDGGAPFRILLGQAAIAEGKAFHFTGTPRLGERPHQPLFDALTAALPSLALKKGTPWPLEVRAATGTGESRFRVFAEDSSQFVTSLLLACAQLQRREHRPWSVDLLGTLTSEGYLELTLSWLARCGFTVQRGEKSFTLSRWNLPAKPPLLPGDWSSLGYLLCMAWRSGSVVTGADVEAAHPDRAILRYLTAVGLRVVEKGALRLGVEGAATQGLDADATECPDLMPTLAALACVLPKPSTLSNVGILRLKESDRLSGIQAMVTAAGGTTQLEANDARLRIIPPANVQPLRIDSHDDHRLAMAAATLSVLADVPLELTSPECVKKSFPGFWRQFAGQW
ncbi:MAG: 3-phosphoshikimate 1-carboxyvinyltransferase [Myxococcaceae bacterium]